MASTTKQKGMVITQGYSYKCGNCSKQSRQFKNESGMKMFCRLHFKKNPKCKAYDKKYIKQSGFNNHFVDDMGRKHNTSSARLSGSTGYTIPKKYANGGHKKNYTKKVLQDKKTKEKYHKNLDEDKLLQMIKDLNEIADHNEAQLGKGKK